MIYENYIYDIKGRIVLSFKGVWGSWSWRLFHSLDFKKSVKYSLFTVPFCCFAFLFFHFYVLI
jgi:hypothetical protein